MGWPAAKDDTVAWLRWRSVDSTKFYGLV